MTLRLSNIKGSKMCASSIEYIERLLGDGRNWALPDGYSVVDPYLLVLYQWGGRVGLNMRASYPAWSRMTDQTSRRPAVQRTRSREDNLALIDDDPKRLCSVSAAIGGADQLL